MRKAARSKPGCDGACGTVDSMVPPRVRERLRQAPVPEAFYRQASMRLQGRQLTSTASRREGIEDYLLRRDDRDDRSRFAASDEIDGAGLDRADARASDPEDQWRAAGVDSASWWEADEGWQSDSADSGSIERSGLDEPRTLRPTFMTDWHLREGAGPSHNPRLVRFMEGSLSGLVTNTFYPQRSLPAAFYYRRRTGPLSQPPRQLDPVVIPRRGTVRRGRTEVPLAGGGNRPYIWLWFEPLANDGCNYRWYQFVQVSFFYKRKLKFPNFNPLMEAATGRPIKFRRNKRKSRWDADYHKTDHADKKTRGPAFRPPGLGVSRHDPGRPFREYDVPGTTASAGGTTRHKGILDAPDFCGDNPPPILRCVLAVLPQCFKRQENNPNRKPAPRTRSASIVIEARSYLTCIKDGKVVCIGYVPWTYTQSATVGFTWRDSGTAGGTTRVYTLTARLLGCTSTLLIGDWVSPC